MLLYLMLLLYLMNSMGGATAVRVAAKRALPTLAGLVVIDVVEVSLRYSCS